MNSKINTKQELPISRKTAVCCHPASRLGMVQTALPQQPLATYPDV